MAAASLGLFSGAMLFIGLAIVPHGMSLAPAAYRADFQAGGPFIGNYMIPLMVLSILLPGICILLDKANRSRWILVTALVFAIVPLYGVVHAPINDLILGATPLSDVEIVGLRGKWVLWHWARTVLGLSAFGISLRV